MNEPKSRPFFATWVMKVWHDDEEKSFHTPNEDAIVPILVWSPPPVGRCKLNTDSSFGANGDAGAGAIVCDESGEINLIIMTAANPLQ
jgi:hypothetical protein